MTSRDTLVQAIEHDLTFLARALEGLSRRRAWPLERAHYLLLNLVGSEGPQTIGTLAARLALDGSTVTRQVAQMERDGLVEKHLHPDDARSFVVSATPRGSAAAAAMRAARRENTGRLLQGWSTAEMAGLATALAHLNASVAAVLEDPAP
ncbi:putative Uncharacterized HTH-type transcriptional regulator YxaD [Rhodovastum atsumiense]|nr:MarR family transcriptional regulator [Rhodovastum atsumiense]CAH2600313.1 putative Uncharacterized HTH-type transcriptional regulator YxaD [Rhodovastum atsumiense]